MQSIGENGEVHNFNSVKEFVEFSHEYADKRNHANNVLLFNLTIELREIHSKIQNANLETLQSLKARLTDVVDKIPLLSQSTGYPIFPGKIKINNEEVEQGIVEPINEEFELIEKDAQRLIERVNNRIRSLSDHPATSTVSTVNANKLKQLLTIVLDCPSLNELTKLPDVAELQESLTWRKPDYGIAFELYNERYPKYDKSDKWLNMRRGYSIAYSDFEKEFESNINTLMTEQVSRHAYLKRIFDKLYSGPSRYEHQDKIASFLRSEKFKGLKSQIDAELWNQLDEIGYAIWQSSAYSMAVDYLIERAFEVEGMPLKFGWRWKEPQENTDKDQATNPATSTEPANNKNEDPNKKQSKKPAARPFANFTDKLQNGFTEQRLNALLVRMLMKDREGSTLEFEKYLLHPVIDALTSEGYFSAGSRVKDFNALAKFLGLSEGRIKSGYGKPGLEKETRQKATTYLQKEHKKNCSNPVP